MIYAECCERGALNCAKFNGKWTVYYALLDDYGDIRDDKDTTISFCPFCGKKLESVKSERVSEGGCDDDF